MNGRPRIEIEPRAALTDLPVAIRISGLEPHRQVAVRARTHDDDLGRAWESHAILAADGAGIVDLGAQAPLSGSYRSVDPMGLFWSMELDPAATEECYFRKRTLDPIRVTLGVEVEGRQVASATAERLFVAPGTVRTEVREGGLAGTLFRPPDPGPHPGVLVLGGADGGILEHGAALLGSRGYAALALGYFGADSLPPSAAEIPLEYFGRAIHWLQARPEVDAARIALAGTSLGGMYALLAAAAYPEVRAVVGYVALGIVACEMPDQRSPCSHRGRPLPCLSVALTPAEEQIFAQKVQAREPVSLYPVLIRRLEDGAATAPAEIPVERIEAPILLLTGADDQAIPSPLFAERIMARLDGIGFPHAHRHVTYAGAGHAIGLPHAHGLPYVPPYGRPPASGTVLAFGGNTRDNARANVDSWARVLDFLAESLTPAPG